MIKKAHILLSFIIITAHTLAFGHYMGKKEQLLKNPLKTFQKAVQRDDLNFFIEFGSRMDQFSVQELETLQKISNERVDYINQLESAKQPLKKDKKKKKYTIHIYLIPWPMILDMLFMNGLLSIGKGIIYAGRSTYTALFGSYYQPYALTINALISDLITHKTNGKEISVDTVMA